MEFKCPNCKSRNIYEVGTITVLYPIKSFKLRENGASVSYGSPEYIDEDYEPNTDYPFLCTNCKTRFDFFMGEYNVEKG
jgi:hypothetical protein